jgi:hypothetical protein
VPEAAEKTAAARTRFGRHTLLAPLVVLACAAVLLAPAGALAITRNTTLSRAQKWVDAPVKYSQSKRHNGYRTDCSGYVSACWATGTSWSTSSFHHVTHKISRASLQPGDAMLKKGYHVRLFYGWLDEAKTQYVAYESGTDQSGKSRVAVCRVHSYADDRKFGFVPTRYNRIKSSPASSNLLHNGTFNSWANTWTSQGLEPLWWLTGNSWGETTVTRSRKTYHGTLSSARLGNTNGDPAVFTEISQSVPVTAGSRYRACAWAKTAFDAHGVELHLLYLDANGQPLTESSTTGDAAGLKNDTFRRMSAELTAPEGAVRARVAIRLAGGTTVNASGISVPGTSAFLDDISLVRR